MDYQKAAIEAAQAAAKVITNLANVGISYSMKSVHDIQAEADVQAEKIIIETIRSQFPTHAIFSEEAGPDNIKSDYMWVVDPIDGTINYSRGIDEYCISIALAHKDEIILGVVYQPVTNRLYTAEKSKGAFLNGQRISISSEDQLINAILATDNSGKIQSRQENFNVLSKICTDVRHIRIFGSGALHLCRLAQGQIDVYYKTRFNYWDYAAGTLIALEAGATVTDMHGAPIGKNSLDIVASNTFLHQDIMNLLG
jgi:myo-inositol-1(or 4)-monophosphatase